jgi:hypothetical protein
MVATSSVVPSASPRYLWNEIVRWTFEACILRKEGRESEVKVLLHERLPALIRAWSERSGQPAEASREQLRSLFSRAQESVELGSIQRRFIVEEVCARLARKGGAASAIRTVAGSPSLQLRRRVPIDDIPAMLDALAEAEFESMGESVLPLRRSVAPPADLILSDEPAQVALSA